MGQIGVRNILNKQEGIRGGDDLIPNRSHCHPNSRLWKFTSFLAIITFCYGFMVIVRGKNVNSLTREVKLTNTCKYVKEC